MDKGSRAISRYFKLISGAPEYPEEREPLADNHKGIHRLDMKTCIGCSACALICPNKTITMVETETGRATKKMPEINLERCLFCSLCEEVCPTKCLILTKDCSLEAYDRREYVRRPEELD
jgi:formate hydrogenlyase subunit 6/NADH:ubiquinone oxidoreductase subunit I